MGEGGGECTERKKSAKIEKFNEYLWWSETHISLKFQRYTRMGFTPPHE